LPDTSILQEQSMKPIFLLIPIAVAAAGLYGCDRSPETTPSAPSSAAGGSSSDPKNRHPSEGVKPAEGPKSGTVSGLPGAGDAGSPPTVGDKPVKDPNSKER
jgi:hypothetical protein